MRVVLSLQYWQWPLHVVIEGNDRMKDVDVVNINLDCFPRDRRFGNASSSPTSSHSLHITHQSSVSLHIHHTTSTKTPFFSPNIIKMQFSTLAVSFLASVAIATPAMRKSLYKRQDYTPCSDTLYSNADCCSVDVLGVADLDCATGKSFLSLREVSTLRLYSRAFPRLVLPSSTIQRRAH